MRDPRPGLEATLWIVAALFVGTFPLAGTGMLGALLIALLAPDRRSARSFWLRWAAIGLAGAGLLWHAIITVAFVGGTEGSAQQSIRYGRVFAMQILLSLAVVVVVYGGTLVWRGLRRARTG